MGSVINEKAYANFEASFGTFVENSAVKGSTIAKIDQFTLTGVKTLKAGEGDFKGNLFRSAAQIASNNKTREMFKKSVADIFGGENKIPNSVKAAMKWDSFDGTGRPLTARRISATWAQIKGIRAEEKCDKIRNSLNAQDWFSGSKITDDVKTAFGSYIEQLSNEMTRAMEKLLLPSIQKGEAPSVEKMKGKFLSLGNGAKVSNEKPTPEANKATRTFLIKLLDDQGKSAGKFADGPDPVISAVKMILAHDLTKEITYGEVVDLFRNVLKSRQDSPTVQRECKNIKEKQETIRDSFQKSLENVRKDYEDDLAARNTKNKTDLFAKIKPDEIFKMIELLSPRVLQLGKEGTDVLEMVEKWATARQQKTSDEAKLEMALEKHGISTDILKGAFPKYLNRNMDPVSVKITVQFWKTTLNDPNHPVEFLAEDATQLGTWHAQKKMADELLGKYLPNVNVNDSFKETTSVVEDMNRVSDVEMEIRNNNEKIGDLKSKIERASSQSVPEELKNYQEAHDFITELSDKDDVDWGEERDKYDGDNQVIKDMLTRFAEEDEEFVDDLARRELSSLYDLIDSMSNLRPELEKKQGELKKELDDLTNRNDALNKDLEKKNALLNDQLKVLDRKDVQRQHSVQKEFLAVQIDGMKYQKYGEILNLNSSVEFCQRTDI